MEGNINSAQQPRPGHIPGEDHLMSDSLASDSMASESITVPVIEEQIHIGKEVIEKGKVRLQKTVHEETVQVNIPLVSEEVNVERIPMNQYIETAPPAVRYEGDTMIVPVLKEVIEKRLILVEELHVTRRQVTSQETQQVIIRKEEVTVDRDGPQEKSLI